MARKIPRTKQEEWLERANKLLSRTRCSPGAPVLEPRVLETFVRFELALEEDNALVLARTDGVIKWLIADWRGAYHDEVTSLLKSVKRRCGQAIGRVEDDEVRACLVDVGCVEEHEDWVRYP